ncbi:hypothetical protein MIR68_010341 [Amoeboaphelidium protococcarum]|nr:hypothetical protein MIR68_010341 [Amoeboaphelidium protococcarum]
MDQIRTVQQQQAIQPVFYICGNCGKDTELKPKDPIRCKECGYRILYKKRTAKIVQYEAR